MLALPRCPAPLLALSALFVLLGGCSVNGSYPDAIEPDAAKLRFVANTSNATLDYFDAAHCDGQTTGILNNMLLSDTARRVGMTQGPWRWGEPHPTDCATGQRIEWAMKQRRRASGERHPRLQPRRVVPGLPVLQAETSAQEAGADGRLLVLGGSR